MRRAAFVGLLLAGTGVAHANDKPAIAPPVPGWMRPIAAPAKPAAPGDAPISVLVSDQQARLERGSVTLVGTALIRIDNAQGLGTGNISLPWRPDVSDLAVHKLAIHRGDKVIDVLASGQTFTVVRREANLENATLDGVLTANIQPEGLQVGDILELQTSVTTRDPVFAGHAEQMLGIGGPLPLDHAHVRLSWPAALPVRVRTINLPGAPKPKKEGSDLALEFTLDDAKPVVPPKLAPGRFQFGRLIEASDFASWADLGALLAPLYAKAAVLPASGPLADEVARIRAASADPGMRATAALALVQDRVRYVALAMGAGGMVPADAATTWSRRYGDCKAKTVLLLGMLRALGIEAEAVAVSSGGGDGIDARLPMAGVFDHVLVRAMIAGKPYWLDGTRIGDTVLDRIVTPNFGWGLPLVPRGAALIRMLAPPLAVPASDTDIVIDATGGLTMPAPVKVTQIFRGDDAVAMNAALGNLGGDARDRGLRDMWKRQYDFIDPSSTNTSFDRTAGTLTLTLVGKARMDWSSGWYETDGLGLGYKADLARDPGPDRDAPFAVAYPRYIRTVETIRLPLGFPSRQTLEKAAVDRTLGGVEYHRRAAIEGRVFRGEATERAIAPEFPAADAPAIQAGLREMAKATLYVQKPAEYVANDGELNLAAGAQPTTVAGLLERGYAYSNHGKVDAALADYDAALKLEPKNVDALANRGLMYVWKDDASAAQRDLSAAEAIAPQNLVAIHARAIAAARRGDFAAAQAFFTKALAIDPKDAYALTERAGTYRTLGKPMAALADLDAVIALNPEKSQLRLARANVLHGLGRDDEAMKTMRDAVAAAAPDDAYARVAAAMTYSALGHREEAMRAFDSALAIKPAAYIYINRATVRPANDQAGRTADIDAALKLEPKSADALAAKADLQVRAGDFNGALARYDAAIAADPKDYSALVRRGATRMRAGRAVDAERDFSAAHALAKTPNALNALCWEKATAGVALDSALAECEAALAQSPKSSAILDSDAFVLLRLGRLEQAIGRYNDALAISPMQSESLYGRGIAYARHGDRAKAEADFAAARRIDANVAARFTDYGVVP